MIPEDIENTIWKININDNFHITIKEKLLSLANDFNITFSDEESLQFESSQMKEIRNLIAEFFLQNNFDDNIIELIMVD